MDKHIYRAKRPKYKIQRPFGRLGFAGFCYVFLVCIKIDQSNLLNVTVIENTPSGKAEIVSFELAGQQFEAISAGPFLRVPVVFNGVNPEIAAMWESLNVETINKLKELSNVEPLGLLSASTNFSEGRMEEKGELDHYIGVATTKKCPDNLTQLEVSASTWAVFQAVGPFPETLQNVWGRIYSEWFPSSNYELAKGPEILWNENKEITSPNFRSEIWIPVMKKSY